MASATGTFTPIQIFIRGRYARSAKTVIKETKRSRRGFIVEYPPPSQKVPHVKINMLCF